MPELKVGVTLPGEAIVVAILQFALKHRETMSQDNRDKWDALQIRMLTRWADFWDRLTLDDK